MFENIPCSCSGPSAVPSTHTVAPKHPSLQFQGIQYRLLASTSSSTHVMHTHSGTHTEIFRAGVMAVGTVAQYCYLSMGRLRLEDRYESVWSMQSVPSQPGLQDETLSQQKQNQVAMLVWGYGQWLR